MNPLLQKLIDAQCAEISDYERQSRDLKQQLAAIEDKMKYACAKLEGLEAAAQITAEEVKPHTLSQAVILAPASPWPLFTGQKPQVLLDNAGRKRRPISEEWQKILRFIAEAGGAKTAQVCAFASDLPRKLVASQLRYYRVQGFLTHDPQNAKYSITETGRAACGLQKGEAQGATNTLGLDFQSTTPSSGDQS